MLRTIIMTTFLSTLFLTNINISFAGDIKAGQKVFNKCKACHNVEEGGKNKLGPNLWNIVGAPIAAVEGYKYSKALKAYADEAGNWNEENLTAWFKKPKDLVRKTKMIFPFKSKPELVLLPIPFLLMSIKKL